VRLEPIRYNQKMKDTEPVHFLPSEEIFEKGLVIFNDQRTVLRKLLPAEIDIQQVGSSAIPGAIGKFDIDIQIRVTPVQFKEVVEIMSKNFIEKHPATLWTDELAIFRNDDENQIDYVVTLINSKYDDYYRVRDFLMNNPDMLQKYNELKRSYEGKPYAEYRKAKAEFLGGNGSVRFLDY
jgi:GrpB-like predicted nucleotidyltransferase (UPF0157 family)